MSSHEREIIDHSGWLPEHMGKSWSSHQMNDVQVRWLLCDCVFAHAQQSSEVCVPLSMDEPYLPKYI